VIPFDPDLIALADDRFNPTQDLRVEANGIPFATSAFPVDRFPLVVARYLGVVELIPTENESVRTNVMHQREHGLEGTPVILGEMTIMRHDPAFYFVIRPDHNFCRGRDRWDSGSEFLRRSTQITNPCPKNLDHAERADTDREASARRSGETGGQ